MENITLRIDQETQDLVLDDSGSLELIGDAETVAQCVRLTLETFKGEWFLDTDHGTDYDQIIADGDGDAETVLRTAIFQETNVQYIDSLTVTRSGRSIIAVFPPNPGSISSVYRGYPAVVRPLSGAFGTMRNISPTKLLSSVNTSTTSHPEPVSSEE